MSAGMASNIKRFTASLRGVARAVKKPEAEIVNKALKDVGFRAMQFTPFAEPGRIQAELYRDNILIRMAVARLKKKGKFTKRQVASEATRILKRRIASSRAARAGWIPGLKALGASVRGAKLRSGGSASRGSAQKATINRLSGVIRNALVTHSAATGAATSVENIPQAVHALNRAIAFVASDREDYARRKLIEKELKKHSDK